jgi:hypothetical protein
MTIDEKMTIGRWVDLGCPINTGAGTANEDYGWFLDDNKPTLDVSLPRPGLSTTPISLLRLGIADAYTGLDAASLSITATLTIEGRPAGAQLSDLFTNGGNGIYTLALGSPLNNAIPERLHVEIADNQGNLTRVTRTFRVGPEAPTLAPRVYVPVVVEN